MPAAWLQPPELVRETRTVIGVATLYVMLSRDGRKVGRVPKPARPLEPMPDAPRREPQSSRRWMSLDSEA